VDDALYIRKTLQNSLEPLGFKVLQATDGFHAKNLLDSHTGDLSLILLDIIMPRMGGVEFLTAIRSEGLQVPVIMLTASASKKALMECASLGISGYLTKPLNLEHVQDKIGEVLNLDLKKEPVKALRVLVLDNNPKSLPFISEIMARATYETDFVSSGQAAMEQVSEVQYNMVLVNAVSIEDDFVKDLAGKLKASEGRAGLLLYTSEVSRFLSGAERRFADRCLSYPFGLEKLDQAIEALYETLERDKT
jgi:CheY-like chemotaxis protein